MERDCVFTEKIIDNNSVVLYHGSEKILRTPELGKGGINNDYGQGFYCTKNKALAGEWAVLWTERDGYINEYSFDYTGLKILYLNRMPVENWIAVLVANRKGEYKKEYKRRMDMFLNEFGMNIAAYDVIEGWRADDSFYTYIRDFFAAALSLEKLKEAMSFGDLGNQICLKSKKAFDTISFNAYYPAPVSEFLQSAKDRDEEARRKYAEMEGTMRGTLLVDLIGRENL